MAYGGKMMIDGNSKVRPQARRGRGSISNEVGRFERHQRVGLDDGWQPRPGDLKKLRTEFHIDTSRSIIARNTSPDIPFDQSINPYRGCEHGCIYCFARPTHAFLGFSAGLDFESKILIKPDAHKLLEKELRKPNYVPSIIAMGTNTDPYQPCEKEFGITREILKVLVKFRHPVSIVTKSSLILRDLDLLTELAELELVQTYVSVTTLEAKLAREMEPRAATPKKRLDAIWHLAQAGIPVGVMVAPVIPGLTDWEMDRILAAASASGAIRAGYILLRLPGEVRQIFEEWLRDTFPDKFSRVMSLLKVMRDGQAYRSEFGTRMSGTGVMAKLLEDRFEVACRRHALNTDSNSRTGPEINQRISQFEVPPDPSDRQLALF